MRLHRKSVVRWFAALPALLSALVMDGCAVGPDFHRPAMVLPAAYDGVAPASPTGASAVAGGAAQTLSMDGDVAGRWWTLLHSTVLTALVEQALRNSPTIAAAEASLRQAQEMSLAQAGTLLPQVNGSFGRDRTEATQTYLDGRGTPDPTVSAYSAQLGLSYTLDVWGGLRRAVEQTAAQAQVQRFQLEAAYLSLGAGVASDVVLAASLGDQIAAQTQLIAFEQRQLRTVARQFVLGGATGTDVATQQAQVAAAQTVLVPLRTQLAQVRDRIAAQVGVAPGALAADLVALPGLDGLTLPTRLPLGVPAALLAQRPDIRAAEATLHAQTAALGVAIAARLPNVTLQAGVGSTAGDIHQLFSPTNGMWSLVNQAVQPIFDAGQLLHRQRAQRAALDQAAAQWRQTVLAALQNTADVLAAIGNDATQLQAALAGQIAAQKALSLASLQYGLGGVSYLSVLSAQQTYQDTVITLVRARAQRLTDTVALFAALGGGWWNRHDLPPPPPGLLSSPLP